MQSSWIAFEHGLRSCWIFFTILPVAARSPGPSLATPITSFHLLWMNNSPRVARRNFNLVRDRADQWHYASYPVYTARPADATKLSCRAASGGVNWAQHRRPRILFHTRPLESHLPFSAKHLTSLSDSSRPEHDTKQYTVWPTLAGGGCISHPVRPSVRLSVLWMNKTLLDYAENEVLLDATTDQKFSHVGRYLRTRFEINAQRSITRLYMIRQKVLPILLYLDDCGA